MKHKDIYLLIIYYGAYMCKMLLKSQSFSRTGGVAWWLDRRSCRRAFPIPALDWQLAV